MRDLRVDFAVLNAHEITLVAAGFRARARELELNYDCDSLSTLGSEMSLKLNKLVDYYQRFILLLLLVCFLDFARPHFET